MSGSIGLDLRYPIGGLFVMLGLVLAGYGAATMGNATMYAKSENVNINFWWGLVLLVVGVLFLLGARRGAARDAAAARTTPAGTA